MSALGGAAQTETWLIAARVADGDRRGADVAGDPRHDLRAAARREGRPGRRDHHRRRRARQRGRPAARRRPHRRAELALDLLPQRPDRRSSRSASPTCWSTSRSRRRASGGSTTPGIAALSVGLVSLLVALDQVADWGWGDPRVIGLLALALVGDGRLRRRSSAAPASHALVPREVMRNESFTASCIAILFMSATFFAALLYLPQFMEKQLGYSPLEAGVGMLPFLAVFAARLLRRRPALQPPRREAAGGVRRRLHHPRRRSSSRCVDEGSGYGALIPGMVVLGIGARQLLSRPRPPPASPRSTNRRPASPAASSTCSRSPAARSASA